MNKKKTINLLEAIAQILLLIATFVLPYVTVVIDKDSYWTRTNDIAEGTYTFLSFSISTLNFLQIAVLGLMIINVVICLVSAGSKSITRDGILHNAITIIIFLVGAIVSFMRGESGYDLTIYPIFQLVFMALSVIIMILSFVKRSKVIVPKEEIQPQQVINNIQETSGADELKKYKDLLDSGVITREEFDAKKKEILGL